MTAPADDLLRSLAELLGRVAQTLRSEDEATGRAAAATQVDQLRELLARTDGVRPAGSAPLFDLAQLGDALRIIADALRASTGEHQGERETEALQAITELRAAMGPLAGLAPARDEAAERERYRQKARAAMDEYFAAHPLKPFKP